MSESKISRRQMIRIGTIGAVSTAVSPLPTSAKSTSYQFKRNSFSISGADGDICFMNAVDMAALLRTKKISAREVMQAHLSQIAKVNAKVNAIIICVLCFFKSRVADWYANRRQAQCRPECVTNGICLRAGD